MTEGDRGRGCAGTDFGGRTSKELAGELKGSYLFLSELVGVMVHVRRETG